LIFYKFFLLPLKTFNYKTYFLIEFEEILTLNPKELILASFEEGKMERIICLVEITREINLIKPEKIFIESLKIKPATFNERSS